MRTFLLTAALTTGFLTTEHNLAAADWTQYRGPNGDGVSSEKLALKTWPAAGLPQVWKRDCPAGFSSFTVANGKAFTIVKRKIDEVSREVCVALDAKDGRELWAAPMGEAKFDGGGDSGGGGDGPRSTPSYDDGLVYTFDARFVVMCLDAGTGKPVWSRDLVKDNGGKPIQWQNAASPLIDGDLVFVAGGGPGQALLGLNKKTGQVVWKGQNDAATHATPVAATILGTRQIIFFTKPGLVAVNPLTGAVLWRYSFPWNVSTAASPVVSGDLVYCSAGYNVGAGLCKITKSGDSFQAAQVWRKENKLFNHWSTPVVKDGYLYGMFSFKEFGKGPLKCVELATGREVWSQPGFGPGNVILVDGRLLVLGDKGQLVLVEATPTSYTEISRMQAIGGKCWSTPAFSNGRVYLRSTTEGVCLDASGQ